MGCNHFIAYLPRSVILNVSAKAATALEGLNGDSDNVGFLFPRNSVHY